MQSRSYYFLLIVLALGLLSGLGFYFKKPNYGLDIKGGVRLEFSMDLSKPMAPNALSDMASVRSRILHTLTTRASGLGGATEAVVQAKGDDRFIVELPGFTDPKMARETLSTTASILWYDALNVKNRLGTKRYDVGQQVQYNGGPAYTFYDNITNKELKPGTPEYKAMIAGWKLILQGDDLKHADAMPQGDSYIPSMEFSSEGAQKLESWSRSVQNRGEQLAAVMDDVVISIAPLKDNTILRDSAQIDGNFDKNYVINLKELLNSGSIPVSLKLESIQLVDPTIGAHALDQIMVAGIASFAVICLFLIVYYAFPGVIALLALCLYILFTITALKLIGATFSLAAIAGFILSVGMAVDANILVFERFKEEMKHGRSLQSSIELGFKRALPAILDSNACTILTSLVLAQLGTGPVKGFASTLIIGVVISLFTAVVVTRSLLMFFVGSGIAANPKWYAVERNWFGERFEQNADTKPLRIVESSRKWFTLSLLTIIPGVIFIFLGGIKPNVEFRGGYEAEFPLTDSSLTANTISQRLTAGGILGSNVKINNAEGQRIAAISVPPLTSLEGDPQVAVQKIATAAGLQATEKTAFNKIGPAVQAETRNNAILGVVISSLLIILYLALRFGLSVGNFVAGLRFGGSAILALLHDILLVVGVAAIFGYFLNWEISALFLTAMLTIIGFSVHDTIVIFDRIRENLHRPQPGEEFGHLVDRSITRSFARSINTSATVIVTLLIIAFFGSATIDLKFFVITMLVGILSGTYSSIYNASPILYLWDRAVGRKKGESHTLVGYAMAELAKNRVVSTAVAPVAPAAAGQPAARTYGQVRRRANSTKSSRIEIEDHKDQ